MQPSYIYIVGKPDSKSTAPAIIRSLGYYVGILQDKKIHIANPSDYDRIEHVDFEKLDEELARLDSLNLNVRGLICTFENYVIAKAKLGHHFNVPAPSIESAELSTDKALMRRAFLDTDTSISPNYASIDSLDQALQFARQHSYPFIIKPTNLVKSLLVLKCENEQQLRERFEFAANTIDSLYKKYNIHGREPQLIIEEFIVGRQYSVAAFVDEKGTPHFSDGIVQLINAQDIGVDDNYLYSRTLPAELSNHVEREMIRVSEIGVKALKMRSIPAHIELMHGPDGVKIIEIGARIGGYRPRMYTLTYGADLTAQEIALAIGEQPKFDGTFQSYCAVYELFSSKEGVFDSIDGEFDPTALAYYRVVAKPGHLTGPAKDGYKAAAIIIVSQADKVLFREICHSVEKATVRIRP
ncbi:MAG: ATP-grasp domain-containing protein [Chloroflexi bacterium]|nr:MAG: ATP-grasp domain-containing protein [Chloroflexota bacterium]